MNFRFLRDAFVAGLVEGVSSKVVRAVNADSFDGQWQCTAKRLSEGARLRKGKKLDTKGKRK